MIKGLMLLADGFEETEAISTHDILTRTHEIEVTYVSISDSLFVKSSMGLKVEALGLLKDVKAEDYDFIVLPGGKVGVDNIKNSPAAIEMIKRFHDLGKKYYAICAAPSILGELGYLDGKNYVCFPGFQKGKGTWTDKGSVIDGDLV
ncbi:MAG: DJ-1/PfpI family protein, partial [Bacilli bacterium]|nr:DJ-1/PfpI family protein [Bacilli bacterium]